MGTLTPPAWAMPRSATVHSTRVEPTSETLSPGFTPAAMRPQAASSPRPASSAQVSGFQPPPVLRSAATRCGSPAARNRNSPATERTVAKSSLSLCIEPIAFCAVAIGCSRSVLRLPLASQVLDAFLLRQVLPPRRVEDLLHQLVGLVRLSFQPVQEQRIREVQLGAPVVRMGADHRPEHLDRLLGVALGPGQLEEVPAPDHLRRAVQVVLVDALRGEHPLPELPLEPLRKSGEDAHAFRVQAHSDAREIMPAHVAGIGLDRLVTGLPGSLPFGGLVVRTVGLAVGLPGHQRRLAARGLESVRIFGEMLLDEVLELLEHRGIVAPLPEIVPGGHPV